MTQFIHLLSLSCLFAFGVSSAQALENLNCQVAIIGGGVGGVHTAYQLAKLPASNRDGNVCLFEKEAKLGGRLFDVALNPAHPDWVIGLGGLRIMETQSYLFKLANDLDITLEAVPYQDDLMQARGYSAFSSDSINKKAYPLLADVRNTETQLYDKLRFGTERSNIDQYPDLRSYMNAVVGTQGYHFLTDVFRFRADFETTLSARGYLDFFDEEWDVCCTPSYPEGGMSQFVIKMADDARQNGAKIYLNEPALKLDKVAGNYVVSTPRYKVTAKKLVIAVPKLALNRIGGTIADGIKKQAQFNDLVAIPVTTIVQRWQTAWWKNIGYPSKNIHRIWTTEHCINAIEIPSARYSEQQLVTRTVYNDKPACVEFWQRTAQLGTPALEAEIERGLHYMLPKATIPKPLNTVFKYWEGAWYWLRGGSQFTNAEIAQWAIEPLAGEQVALVNDAYNPQRAGWSDAAYKSSINVLNSKYGFAIKIPITIAKSAQRSHTPTGR